MKLTPTEIHRHFIHLQTNLVAAKVAHDVKNVLLKHRPNNLIILATIVFSVWFGTLDNASARGKLIITSEPHYKDLNELLDAEELKSHMLNKDGSYKYKQYSMNQPRPIDGKQPVIEIRSKNKVDQNEFTQLVSNLNNR